MKPRKLETQPVVQTFDFSAFPADTLFLDRRSLPSQPDQPNQPDLPKVEKIGPRPRKERRRRVDPTTFEKQYSESEIAFMNAIQDFKCRSGKMFPSHGDILKIALQLGYRQPMVESAAATDQLANRDILLEAAPVVRPV